ncbi:MAG TPA: GNAT family N-acetyltransferase [Candidatus Saccharimonadales bacterium]|nr:GNAT family N-acetyltransferase [Candidatus Saccharimonadales bacterium]
MTERSPDPSEIRSYTASDYEVLAQLLQEAGIFYEPFHSPARVGAKIARDPESILIAEREGEVIGTASIMEDGSRAFIFGLAVAAEQQRQGVGSQLMAEAESLLKSRGYEEVHILVDDGDDELQAFYERHVYDPGHAYRWMTKGLG